MNSYSAIIIHLIGCGLDRCRGRFTKPYHANNHHPCTALARRDQQAAIQQAAIQPAPTQPAP
ncbi:hypothetical protein LINGRAHAP2_LOCUS18485, partial [Linum grandiflorum]